MDFLQEGQFEYGNQVEETRKSRVLRILLQTMFLYQTAAFISDHNIVVLLNIFRFFIWMLWSILSIETLKEFHDEIPKTLYSAKRFVGIDEDSMYTRWVVCVNCSKLFPWKDVVKDRSKLKCDNILYPNHPNLSQRRPCNTRLLDKIISANGKKDIYRPRKVYCTRSIKDSLEMFFKRKGFKDSLLSFFYDRSKKSTILRTKKSCSCYLSKITETSC